jgi:archaellin
MPSMIFNGSDMEMISYSLQNTVPTELSDSSGSPGTSLILTVKNALGSRIVGRLVLVDNAGTEVDELYFTHKYSSDEYQINLVATATSSNTANTSKILNYDCANAEFASGGQTKMILELGAHADGVMVDVREGNSLGSWKGLVKSGGVTDYEFPFHVAV